MLEKACRLLTGQEDGKRDERRDSENVPARDVQEDDQDDKNDLREQMLRGYRYILVDEYQDIDELQYSLVEAVAGRTANEDKRLCILAVGDDDQNIYAWRETTNKYIQRFQEEYSATLSFLVENYRSSEHIIQASNRVIEANPDRMKAETPIRINKDRQEHAAGGVWEQRDPERQGRVLRIEVPAVDRQQGNLQAQAVMAELRRLLAQEEGEENWEGCAVLARGHRYLWPIQAWCEQNGIPYFLAADKDGALALTCQREFVDAMEQLRTCENSVTVDNVAQILLAQNLGEGWSAFFQAALMQLHAELGNCQLGITTLIDWLYEYARDIRRQPGKGLYLGTVHSAKGLEFRHVVLLDGQWDFRKETSQDERRLYYVGMTRAEETLTLCEFAPGNPFAQSLGESVPRQVFAGKHDPALEIQYQDLILKDIDLGFAGRSPPSDAIHSALRRLRPRDPLLLEKDGDRYLMLTREGQVVGRTSKSFELRPGMQACEVVAFYVRYASEADEKYRTQLKSERWEVLVPRLKSRHR